MEENEHSKPKYYKMHLDPLYEEGMVSKKTDLLWKKEDEKNLQKLQNFGK